MPKKILLSLTLGLVAFLTTATDPSQAQAAASINFSETAKTVKKDDAFTIDVNVNTDGADTYGADAKIVFPTDKLEVTSNPVTGNFYPQFSAPFSNPLGTVELHSYTTVPGVYIKGSGTLGKITFKAKVDTST